MSLSKKKQRAEKQNSQIIEAIQYENKQQNELISQELQTQDEQDWKIFNKKAEDPRIEINKKRIQKLNEKIKQKQNNKQDVQLISEIESILALPEIPYTSNKPINYYIYRETLIQEQINKKYNQIQIFHSKKQQSFNTFKYKGKAHPIININANKNYCQSLNPSYYIDQFIFDPSKMNQSFHGQVFGNITFFKEGDEQLSEYQQRPSNLDLQYKSLKGDSLIEMKQLKKAQKTASFEMFTMCRTSMDVRVEYIDSDHLKRLRFGYISHLVDYLVNDRKRVAQNDFIQRQEALEGKLTLDNVFQVAEQGQPLTNNVDETSEEEFKEQDYSQDGENEKENNQKYFEGNILSKSKDEELQKTFADNQQDQGFTRPKILILTGFKHIAFQIIESIIFLMNNGNWRNVKGRKRFKKDFGDDLESFNDDFIIGISSSFNIRKTPHEMNIKLYETLYESDIIIASPLGLRIATGLTVNDIEKQQKDKDQVFGQKGFDFEFLSSIEFLVLDQSEAFVFQNLEHLEEILKILNKKPKKLSGLNDITRLKDLYTQSDQISAHLCKYFRQNIIIQKFQNQELNFILDQNCNQNFFGQIEMTKIYENNAQQICNNHKVKCTLRRVPYVTSFEHGSDARYKFFTKKIWDGLYNNNQGYTILFVHNYFDFVKLRTFIKNRNAQVAFISEYSEKKSCQKARQAYESGSKPILMITERALVFQKIRLRYARNVVMYGLPESIDTITDCLGLVFNSQNWKPILNSKLNAVKLHKEMTQNEKIELTKQLLIEKHTEKSLVGLFDQYDQIGLEKLVGTGWAKKIIFNEGKDSFSFN